MQSQFLQRTNFIKTKSRYCISLNEHIVDMVYNIASNTQRILNVVWREDIIYEYNKKEFCCHGIRPLLGVSTKRNWHLRITV